MRKVLHICAGADIGGISQVVLNYYKFIDKGHIRFDVAFTTECQGQNKNMLEQLGSNIYQLPLKSQGIKNFEQALEEIIKNNSYDCIHVHENATSYVALRVAKKMGVNIRIAHAHSCVKINTFYDKIRRISGQIFNYVYATDLIACGVMAGNTVFGKLQMKSKKSIVLKNAIDSTKYKFNAETRNSLREKYDLNDKYILGMVGRLEEEKNYFFALKLIKEMIKSNPFLHLFIIGTGSQKDVLEEFVEKNDMKKYVTLYGKTDKVEDFYQLFDILLLPSFYEGFPLVVVEACASGLPVITSDCVSKEILCFDNVNQYNLNNVNAWKKAINSQMFSIEERNINTLKFKRYGFDLKQNVQHLEEIYLRED